MPSAKSSDVADPIVALQIQIEGRVQGVFFRASALEQAQALSLTGAVQNRADGSVEVTVQGSRSAVETLVRYLHHGPDDAIVNRVAIVDIEPSADLVTFRTLRD